MSETTTKTLTERELPNGERDVFCGDLWLGFRPSGEQQLYLQRCPECYRENYAMAVLSGACAWCGWRER